MRPTLIPRASLKRWRRWSPWESPDWESPEQSRIVAHRVVKDTLEPLGLAAGLDPAGQRSPLRRRAGGPVLLALNDLQAGCSESERARLIEGTGLERARRAGKRLGRPRASQVMLHAARDLVEAGVPVAEAARRKGVARATLQRFIGAGLPDTKRLGC